ncbi:tetracenomycin A2 monooxygenase-dioxygenase [Actinoalloteichus hoggarensis]|uniref:2,4-dichlorophenol 6-monooxygenase n=1 Tax=Actinoalloteichus hoggarensis TaxID=1470176 RepID=A0A221W1K7_9PSEU|nr:FAD-dependent monooxygenase [Actinoalloteichus hoggarensis]ASO19695.1 2,4-dichlorophenol 6-monooxygenase [Actinoalloteichus hoggarensis]MBB5919598.1 tetracenomycin A2 monooxygenase-dioxygenase [Actinoalloteichus hoggarensis]
MYDVKIPVLIVGGGPVGLSSALFLGRHGIKTMLVEKRDGTSRLPRAPGLQARTMELFRAAGFHEAVRALEMGDSHPYFEGGIIQVNTFAEIDDAVVLESPSLDGPDISPERVMGCGQDRYERVLVDIAKDNGSDVRFNTSLQSFEQDAEGVTAIIEDLATGTRTTVRADYLIGADGANSRTRTTLGVEREGRGTVFNALSIYFRAPELEALLKDRKFILCYATAAPGTLMGLSRLHGCDPWLAAPLYHPDQGEKPEDFTDERCIDIVRTAAGKDDLHVEIMDKVPWQGAQLVAETFRRGRVFLAGDAAHLHPPAGGFGANTGIHDAHNLAWKLASVLKGVSGDALLETYDAERRRVGEAMAEQAMVRNRIRHGYADDETRALMVDDVIITLGYRYNSTSIQGVEPDARVLSPKLTLTGAPGTRAPHVWLRRDGERISTVDLFWDEFVLLTGSRTSGWAEAADRVAKQLGVPLRCEVIGPDGDLLPDGRNWAQAYGVGPQGAVLVRPDAFVAWRQQDAVEDADRTLTSVVAAAAGLDPDVIG